jgi:hypothetical protein
MPGYPGYILDIKERVADCQSLEVQLRMRMKSLCFVVAIFLAVAKSLLYGSGKRSLPIFRTTDVMISHKTEICSSLPSSDAILDLVAETDRGASADADTKEMVDSWIFKKSDEYTTRLGPGKTALDDPLIFGNYNVSYVGVGKDQRGNPAGGRYRGFLGRLLYRNEGLYQHILKEEATNGSSVARTLAINNVRGRLLSLIPLSVVLKGVVQQISDARRTELMNKFGTKLTASAVKAVFEAPYITIGGVTLQVGPPSSVVLDTPYVDDRVRLGVGSRGSTFVFARTDDAASYKWKQELSKPPLKGRRVGLLFALATVALNTVLKGSFKILGRIVSVPLGIFSLLLLLSKGGIIDEREDP